MKSKNGYQGKLIYNAAKKSFEADRDEALAVLSVFFESPMGVAEHTGFVNEVREHTKKLAEAEEALASLEEHFGWMEEI